MLEIAAPAPRPPRRSWLGGSSPGTGIADPRSLAANLITQAGTNPPSSLHQARMRDSQQEALNLDIETSGRLPEFTLRGRMPTVARVAWAGGIALTAAYCVLFVLLSPLPVQDLPDHLARATAMSDLLFHGGKHFGGIFQFHLLWIPYLLGDLILAVAVDLLGPTGGAALWVLLVFLSFPCAALFYLRVRGIEANGRPLLLLLALYLATDWFFLMGFLGFRLSVAMLIATLGMVELLRRRWSYGLFALYVGAVVLDYLMHLSPIVFLAAALAVTALVRLRMRTTTVRLEIALLMPVLATLLWQFTVASGYRERGDQITSPLIWGTWISKFARVGSQFFHFTPRVDVVLVLLFAASLVTWVGVVHTRDLRRPLVSEMLVLSITFVAMFFALPLGYAEAYYVDTRPLPLASFFFICACLALPRPDPAARAKREPIALLLATALVIGNIAYLTHHFVAERAWINTYRSIVARLPLHARVLPIYTHGGEGAVVPFLHTSGYLSIDREAVEPYVFAADNGNPMKYFRYAHLPYDPPEVWYGEIPRPRLDWRAVAHDYDFLLITKPYDPRVLGLATRPIADNSTATLLAVVK
jgi:hypothetical protein